MEEVRQLGEAPQTAETTLALRKALEDRSNLIVAQAAKVIHKLQLRALLPDLLTAFDRMLMDGTATDPQCRAKIAIVNTLKALDYSESAVFLRGMKHVQWEPVWGGQEDSAAALRGTCALSLVQCSDLTREKILTHLVDAFTDREDSVRADAARALEQVEGCESALLLRFKARIGDEKSRVIGQALESLLNLQGVHAIPFIVEFLESREGEICEEAALVLASSRLPQAFAALKDAWSRHRDRPRGDLFLRAIGISRLPEAVEFLASIRKATEG